MQKGGGRRAWARSPVFLGQSKRVKIETEKRRPVQRKTEAQSKLHVRGIKKNTQDASREKIGASCKGNWETPKKKGDGKKGDWQDPNLGREVVGKTRQKKGKERKHQRAKHKKRKGGASEEREITTKAEGSNIIEEAKQQQERL